MLGFLGLLALILGSIAMSVAALLPALDDFEVQVAEMAEYQSESAGETGGAVSDDVVGCTMLSPETLELEVINNWPTTSSYTVTIGLFDDDGQRVGDEGAFVSYLRPGERAIIEPLNFEHHRVACESIEVERFAAAAAAAKSAYLGDCEMAPVAGALGLVEAVVTATNGTSTTQDFTIDVAFIDPAGVRRGWGAAAVEALGPGETAVADVSTMTEFSEEYSCDVVGIEAG